MTPSSPLFEFLSYQLQKYPKPDMLNAKINGQWSGMGTQEVWDTVEKLAAAFVKNGWGPNDHNIENVDKIAVISKNRPEWIIFDMACQMAGVISCPIYPTTHVNELEYIFNDAGVKAVFLSGEDINHKVSAIKDNVPSLQKVYAFDHLPDTIYWKELLKDITAEDLGKMRKVRNAVNAEACATIIYTSGTTGKPKGVMLSHRNVVTNVLNSVESFPFPEEPNFKVLSFLPLNHIFERMVTYIYIYTGVSIFYAESLDTIADNVKEIKPNGFCTVPRLLEKVYEKIMQKGQDLTGFKKKLFDWSIDIANQYDNSKNQGFVYNSKLLIANKLVFSKWREALGNNIKFIITGGAAAQERLIRIFTAAGVPIFEGYGPTENSPVITVNRNTPGGTKFGSVGPPIVGQEVKLMADGEICVKGPSVMMGYYKMPGLTAETVIDGWLHTGDIGIWQDKFLKITDRKKELFKTSGGKYVAPQPVENKLKESPYIEQVMVLGAEQKFVGALIVPSVPNLKIWMKDNGLTFSDVNSALQDPKVLAFYRELVASYNKFFNNVEQVKKFELLPDEWTIDTGELTPTLKLKRKIIMEKYKDVVQRIYE